MKINLGIAKAVVGLMAIGFASQSLAQRGDRCRDSRTTPLCKVWRGDNSTTRAVDAWTDCGRGYPGDRCYYIDTPGFRQLRVDMEFVCRNGQWQWVDNGYSWCELERRRRR